jgi:hypothetical protein
MKRIYVYALIALAATSAAFSQMPGNTNSTAPQVTANQDATGSLSLSALVLRLNNSFQAVSNARDSRGYVMDSSILKTHSTNLNALKKALRGKRGELLITPQSQRRKLKAEFRALDDSFDQFLLAHDAISNPEVVVYMDIKESFSAHDAALKRLNQFLDEKSLAS